MARKRRRSHSRRGKSCKGSGKPVRKKIKGVGYRWVKVLCNGQWRFVKHR